jgi:hypothetical protein
VEVLDFTDLGMEAVWRIEVADFPAFVVTDDKGNDFFDPAKEVPIQLDTRQLTGAPPSRRAAAEVSDGDSPNRSLRIDDFVGATLTV